VTGGKDTLEWLMDMAIYRDAAHGGNRKCPEGNDAAATVMTVFDNHFPSMKRGKDVSFRHEMKS
jgi:hypothetical protein